MTVISDLNDDCFQEVFKHLNLTDLCAVADFCRRFRQNGQSTFSAPKFKNDVLHIDCSTNTGCGKIFLRGRDTSMYVKSIEIYNSETNTQCRSIFDLIGFYFRGTVIDLDLHRCNITSGDIESTVRPLLHHLQKLSLHDW